MKKLLIFMVSFFYFSPLMAEITLKCELINRCKINYNDNLGEKCLKGMKNILVNIDENKSFMELQSDDYGGQRYQMNETTFEYFGFDVSFIKEGKIGYYLETIEYLKENYNDNVFKLFNDKQERLSKIFGNYYHEFNLNIYDLDLNLITVDLSHSAIDTIITDSYSCEKIEKKL
tara:strand:+ start:64 stop:585 length:522 start_codon:yes stop_codon:yes gene_type:complete